MARYNIRNIRTMLTEGFNPEELRELAFDDPDFRPVYDQLSSSAGKAEIIQRLIEYAERRVKMEALLGWARERNPARYGQDQQYSDSPIGSTPSAPVSSTTPPVLPSSLPHSRETEPIEKDFPFDVFLCHNSKDKDIVRRVAVILKEVGLKTWFDEEQILGGDKWQDMMAQGLRASSATMVFIGQQGWGDWQLEELQVALSQGAGQKSHRVIPVLLPPLTKVPDNFPAFLKTRHALQLPQQISKDSINDLVRSIRERQ